MVQVGARMCSVIIHLGYASSKSTTRTAQQHAPLMSVLVELHAEAPGPWRAPALALLLLTSLVQALGHVLLWHAWMPCLLWTESAGDKVSTLSMPLNM
jgi:hypothetical protein